MVKIRLSVNNRIPAGEDYFCMTERARKYFQSLKRGSSVVFMCDGEVLKGVLLARDSCIKVELDADSGMSEMGIFAMRMKDIGDDPNVDICSGESLSL